MLATACCLGVVASAPAGALGESFPNRPVKIVVPTAPGGLGDVLARHFGARLATRLDVPVVIENRPGANGVIAAEAIARAPPDGYTLLFATAATQVVAALTTRLPIDMGRDFTPVFDIAFATSVVVVNERLPVKTLSDLARYASAHPGLLNYASSGVGSANHIDTAVLAAVAGIELVHVPYRGTADGYRALVADEVQVMAGAVTSALPVIRAGKARPLVVLTDRRSPVLPDVPTLAEAGYGDVDVRKWLGFVAPAGTPPQAIARLNAELESILADPATRDWMERQGLEPAGGSPASFARYLAQDEAKWRAIVARLGIGAPAPR